MIEDDNERFLYSLNLGEQPCKLICTTTSSAYYFGNVEDGAKCFPGSDSNDVCIDGICKVKQMFKFLNFFNFNSLKF